MGVSADHVAVPAFAQEPLKGLVALEREPVIEGLDSGHVVGAEVTAVGKVTAGDHAIRRVPFEGTETVIAADLIVPEVALARRGDEPTLDEVLGRFPDLRFVRLRPTPMGQIVARDVTDAIKAELDLGADPDELRQN